MNRKLPVPPSFMVPTPTFWRPIVPPDDLTKGDRKVLSAFDVFARRCKSATFKASFEEIAMQAGVAKITAQRGVNHLVAQGFVERTTADEWHRHIPNTYRLLRNMNRYDAVPPARQAPGLTPLDYPGAKSFLVPTVADWISEQHIRSFVEPFCGGASVGLAIAHLRLVDEVILIDSDPDLAALWHTIINDRGGPEYLCAQSEALSVTDEALNGWLKNILSTQRERAFRRLVQSVFTFNGLSRPDNAQLLCTGRKQRWNPIEKIKRLCFIRRMRNRLRFIEGDALKYMSEHCSERDIAWFIDAPYPSLRKGRDRLYQTSDVRTRDLFNVVDKLSGPWLMTNEDQSMIRDECDQRGFQYRRVMLKSNLGRSTKKSELIIGRGVAGLNLHRIEEACSVSDDEPS